MEFEGRVEPELMVELTAPAGHTELAADELWQLGATAVEVRDITGESSVVVASFPTAAATRQIAAELADRAARLVAADPAWRTAWRRYAEPVHIGRRLVVAPAWRPVAVGSGPLVLRIDPGDCFGSGSHPSTRMILAELQATPPGPTLEVLDVGCGSGILSVAAAALGLGRATAIDIDEAALITTRANSEANGVADRVMPSGRSLTSVTGPFDLALVNVTAAVHAQVGLDVMGRMRAGGRILLAGLLPGQWRHVAGAYAGTTVTRRLNLEGWEGLDLTVRPDPEDEGPATGEGAAAADASR